MHARLSWLIIVLSADSLDFFGVQLQSFLHIFCRACRVTIQQLGATAFMIGLCEIRVQFDGFVKECDSFGILLLDDIKLSQAKKSLFVEWIQFCYIAIIGFGFFLLSRCFFHFTAE